MPKKTAQAKATDESPPIFDEIFKIVDDFCRQHLNEEYALLCRKLAEKLARMRPSPLVGGKPNVWACGIIRTIGWVNFLDDRTQKPHLKFTAIDKELGVAESTGQGKSKLIRNLLKIHQFDHHWTLPDKMADNSAMWLLQVNGFIMDIRRCSREAQVIAFEKGLIPYIPDDRTDQSETE